jgi:hypothetical protein
MSIYNYVVTAHKPTNVTHSAVGNFTSPTHLNLIIAYPPQQNLVFVDEGCETLACNSGW